MGVWVLVGIGVFLFLVGFLGCCGAWCENRCLLGMFFTIVLICFIIELGGGIAAFVLKDKVKSKIKEGLNESLKTADGKKGFGEMQEALKCCGIDGTYIKGSGPGGDVAKCATGVTVGCFDKMWNGLKKNAIAAGGAAVGILVIELLAMIFACVMCSAIKEGKYGYA
jgi:hypothetical protein